MLVVCFLYPIGTAKDGMGALVPRFETKRVPLPSFNTTVQALCQHGADVNARDKFGETPLMTARGHWISTVAEYVSHYAKRSKGIIWQANASDGSCFPGPHQTCPHIFPPEGFFPSKMYFFLSRGSIRMRTRSREAAAHGVQS